MSKSSSEKKSPFKGFTDAETFTQVPESFFRRLLPEIESLDELKVTLYLLWRIYHMESSFRCLSRVDIGEDKKFMDGISPDELDSGLSKAVQRKSLLRVERPEGVFYFLNSPRGRANAEAMNKGGWEKSDQPASIPPPERSNIYKLYEQNIGPLTPLIADALKDAETEYPPEWIEEAINEAVKRNKRNWKYVEAILRGWKEEGRGKEQNRQNAEELRGRDVEKLVDEFRKRSGK
jgi:DnaD/phage-associated family protein